ncbi:MAG: hypothetical protein CVV27_06660 [Candidatus Melainabacteria bacterium HGW-Melainabacteria-1]|nr:MAG: hypothetical protein CVV27_06660 [Candidatus Melainabacteria bacterium HGW-Melainabacteria-1]
MSDDGIPEDIKRFIHGHIDSVAKLEALLLLRNQPEQAWDPERLARRLYVSASETGQILNDLAASALCVPVAAQSRQYHYQPTTAELRNLVERLADLYSRRLIPVTNLIHQRASGKSSAQQFADAFKLRKEKDS